MDNNEEKIIEEFWKEAIRKDWTMNWIVHGKLMARLEAYKILTSK